MVKIVAGRSHDTLQLNTNQCDMAVCLFTPKQIIKMYIWKKLSIGGYLFSFGIVTFFSIDLYINCNLCGLSFVYGMV